MDERLVLCHLLVLLVLRSDLPRSLIIAPWVCAVPGNAGPVSASAYLLAHPFSASSELEHSKSARLIPKRHENLSLDSVGAPLPSCLHAVRVCSRSLSGSSLRLALLKAENTTTVCHTQHNVPFAARAAISHVFRVILAQGPETLLPHLIWQIVLMMHWWALHLKEQQRPPAAMVALPSCHSADFSDICTSVLNPSFRVSVSTSSHRSSPRPVTCYRRHLSKYST